MGSFIEDLAEISSKDEAIVDFANFCFRLHSDLGCEDQGCNFVMLVQDLMNAVKQDNVSVEERKKSLYKLLLRP